MIARRAAPSPAHLETLARLHEEAFAPERGWSAGEIAALAEGGLLLSAEDGSAFALLSRAADEAELLTIAVAAGARRRGLGARLLAAAEAAARAEGARLLHLEVAEDNEAARRLYAAAGWEEAGRRPRYYLRPGGARVDAVLMRKAAPAP